MTFISGIVCQEGIVVAADSQFTQDERKISWADKISIVHFGKVPVIVAGSGVVLFTNQAIGILEKKAKDVDIEKDDIVPQLVVESVRQVRTEQMALHPRKRYVPKYWNDFFMGTTHNFELMVGYFRNGKPCLGLVNIAWCVWQLPSKRYFHCSGSGGAIGKYLLERFCKPRMGLSEGTVMSLYIAEMVSKMDLHCSLPIRLATLYPAYIFSAKQEDHYAAHVFDDSEIDTVSDVVGELDKRVWGAHAREMARQLHHKTLDKVLDIIRPRVSVNRLRRRRG